MRKLAFWLSKKCKEKGVNVSGKDIWQALLIVSIGSIAALLITIGEQCIAPENLTEIPRQKEVEGTYELFLEIQEIDGEEKEVMLTVPERKYEDNVIEQWFQEGYAKIEHLILGENSSLESVMYDLHLITELPDTPVKVSWSSSSPELLSYDGKLSEDIPKEGKWITLYGTFSCQEKTKEFEIRAQIFPSAYLENDWEREVQNQFETENVNNNGDHLNLPKQINGKEVQWRYPKQKVGGQIFFLALFAAMTLLVLKHRESVQQERKKKEQMLIDYPEILNKFSLLLSAGMNSRKAFAKVVLDYRKEAKKPRAAYEAMAASYLEMEQGVPEAEAYEHLGMRCDLPVYKTFSTLLVQNLRKGNRELLNLMEREAMEAFETRKRRAKVLGEKAGTKLLFPMMGMLMIVFVILLIPAWISF